MSFSLDTRVRDMLEPLCLHDPDMKALSPSQIQALFRDETISSLRERLLSLKVIECEGQHDDPCSSVKRDTCPLRELNLGCGHQALTEIRVPEYRRWKTPLSVIIAGCQLLFQHGDREKSDRLEERALRIAEQLYIADAAAYLSYHRLRTGRVYTSDELVGFPASAWTHPLSQIADISALKAAIRESEITLGGELQQVRDEVLHAYEALLLGQKAEETATLGS